MTLTLAQRLHPIKPSITLAITARAARLRAEGVDVIGFGAGEPDFDTPTHIKEAAKKSLDAGDTKYTHVAGIPALRQAIAQELLRAHGLHYALDDVIVTCGAKHAFYNLCQVLLDPGDEVIIPAPYWVSYPDMVLLADGKPVILPTRFEDGFLATPDALAQVITPKTRAFVLCSPSNPTGAAYDRHALERLIPLLEAHSFWIISDDIYRRLVYGNFVFHHLAALSEKLSPRTIIVDGFSKTYAMTGWRLGYAAGPHAVIDAMHTLQGQSTSNVTSFTQKAAIAALEGPQAPVEAMRQEFQRRRDCMLALINAIPHVRCFEPQGAFYCFPDLSAYLGRTTPQGNPISDDIALCDYLLNDSKIAVVPGSGFGAPGFVRLSYATSLNDITRGLERMAKALSELGS